jgi:hypothetical protein
VAAQAFVTDLDELSTLDAEPPPERPPGELGIGDRIADKYTIVGLLGSGGMGAVYLARDERLARDVAIKIGLTTSVTSLARAEREGQVLAKLTDPNVVVIYEVGEHAGRVFVAMEHVGGGTARAWLAAKPRTWRQIVELYANAGAGLAAAHAAGIVHRDFKPDNVLVGDDGRPRVADFGLARAGATPVPEEIALVIDDGSMSDPLTRTGVAVGTPAYMAPEQLAPGRVAIDAWSDQFSFCVTLWEALHGARPFIGADRAELRAAMRVPPKPPKPSAAAVPRSITAVLLRGLAVDPGARWPSVGVLVAGLRRGRSRRGVSLALGLGAAAVVTALLAPLAATRGDDPCGDADIARELAPVWSPARELGLASAFGDAGGSAAWPAIDARLRGYAAGWLDADRATCRAAQDGGESAAMLDKRVACIGVARAHFAAAIDALAVGDRAGVAAALTELAALPPHAECTDLEALSHAPSPPSDPLGRVQAVAIEALLARADAARLRGDASAAPLAAAAGERTSRWPIIEPTATRLAGMIDLDRGAVADGRVALEAAATAFLADGYDHAAAKAMLVLANSYDDTGATSDAEHWAHLAEPLVHRLHDPPELLAALLRAFARTREAGSRDAGVLRMQAADLVELAGGDRLAYAFAQLDRAMASVDRNASPSRDLALGRDELVQLLGADHVELAPFDLESAKDQLRSGRPANAEADARRAIAAIEHWYGAVSARLVEPRVVLARALVLEQRAGEAAAMLAATNAIAPAAPQRVRAQFHVAYAEALVKVGAHGDAVLELARAKSEYATLSSTPSLEQFELDQLERSMSD